MFYEYFCDRHGRFEVKRPINESSETICPKCGQVARQLFTPPTVIWKGNFRWWKGNPEVDMDEIEAEQNKQGLKQAKAKIKEGIKTRPKTYF